MIIKNLKIVLQDRVIENGYLDIDGKIIKAVFEGEYKGNETAIDGNGKIALPGFIDIHIHGSNNIDFMDATKDDYKVIANGLYSEGVTTFLATTLTSDNNSLAKVCKAVKEAKNDVPSLGGIHFEGPYISAKHKGAQNEDFIRNPDINELKELQKMSGNNVKYITLAPEKEGALDFIAEARKNGVVCSAGHTDATFDDVEKAIKVGLTNTTHTHNAMSGHHHRNPGVVTAAMYFNELFTEAICDGIHVCPNSLKTFYKIVGPDRFVIVTDALKIKNSSVETFKLFGLDCVRKNGAAYLTSGPLAGSLLTMDKAIRNLREWVDADLVSLAKISSTNAARSIGFNDRGAIEEGKLADIVLLNNDLTISEVFKEGIRVFENK